jgi:hypothetical protein
MKIGMLYNVFVCWAIFITGLITAFTLFRKPRIDFENTIFANFWLFMSIMWFFSGLRNLAAFFNNDLGDKLLFYVVTLFLAAQSVCLFTFIFSILFKNKRLNNLILSIAVLISLLYFIVFVREGVLSSEITYWGREWIPGKNSNFIFKYCFFIPLIGALLINLIRKSYNFFLGNKIDWLMFFLLIAVSLYVSIGIVDALGNISGPYLLLVRIFLMLACLCEYLAISIDSMLANLED